MLGARSRRAINEGQRALKILSSLAAKDYRFLGAVTSLASLCRQGTWQHYCSL